MLIEQHAMMNKTFLGYFFVTGPKQHEWFTSH